MIRCCCSQQAFPLSAAPSSPHSATHHQQHNQQVGNATLKFVAVTGGGADSASDALEVTLPVLGRQGDVYIATSFAIRPNASR